MLTGKRDDRITVQTLTVGRDSYGGKTETWTTLVELWADAVPWRGTEAVHADQVVALAEFRFEVAFRSDFDEKARVLFKGVAYDILRIEELGRQAGMNIYAKRP